MKHIGLDVHSTTTSICVLDDQGKVSWRGEVPSVGQHLRQALVRLPGAKQAVVEESQMADWVVRELEGVVDRVVRCEPQANRLITGSEDKRDRQDAESLAVLLQLNRIKPVHHPSLEYHRLRNVLRGYMRGSQDLARAKQRVKAYFLEHGIADRGGRIYLVRYRAAYRESLELRHGDLEIAERLWRDIDERREVKAEYVKLLRCRCKPWKDRIRRLQGIPGIGPIGAYTLVAYLEDGNRFSNKRKAWRYGGLGLRCKESGGGGYRKASRRGNRYVKNVLMTAVAAIARRSQDSALGTLWALGMAQRMDAHRLRRKLARKILSTVQWVLRHDKEYDDGQVITGWTGSR